LSASAILPSAAEKFMLCLNKKYWSEPRKHDKKKTQSSQHSKQIT